MLDLSGRWRYGHFPLMLSVEQDPEHKDLFNFYLVDGKRKEFYGHGCIEGDRVIVSWRSDGELSWIGHGSAESTDITYDRIIGKPIEIHWTGNFFDWFTLSH